MLLVRFLVSILSLLLLPCTYIYPKHWKIYISTFIVMNTLTFVVYNYLKSFMEIGAIDEDIDVFYKAWNLTNGKSLGGYVPHHTSKAATAYVSGFNPKTSKEALFYAFISLLFNGAWVQYPLCFA